MKDVNSTASTLGFGITVFAQVGLSNQSEVDLNKFEELLKSWPMVRECHLVSGEADYILKIVSEDWDTYQKFLTQNLTAAPNISHVKSALGVRVAKYKPGVPVEIE